MDFFNRITERFIEANRKLRKLHRVVSVLAAIVVFATTYALILPAITLDQDTATAQSGIEVAASDHETDSGGGVYEEEPEDESDEDGSGGQQDEEILSEDSDSQGEDISEDDDPGRDTEPEQGQNTDEHTEIEEFPDDDGGGSDETDPDESDSDGSDPDETRSDETLEDDPNAETPADGEILTDGESLEEIKLITEKTLLTYEYTDKYYEDGIDDENDDGIDDGYFVYAEIDADAKLPEGVELSAEEITKEGDSEAYEAYYEKALSGLQDKYDKDDENAVLSFARFYDIRFVYNGEEVEPAAEVKVRIEYKKALEIEKATNIDTVHFDRNNGEEPEIIKTEVNSPESIGPEGSGAKGGEGGEAKGGEAKRSRLKAAKSGAFRSEADTDNGGNEIVKTVDFESDRFSVYGIVGTVIVKTVLASDGNNYNVTVTCGPEAGIPADAELAVEEITEGSSANGMSYEDYVAYTENALGIEEGGSGYIRLFDISIVMDGEKIQPADGSSVGVRIELADSSSDRLNVVHFPDGSEEGEEVESSTENGENGSVVEFRADGFSVYSIVDAPKPVHFEPYDISSVEEIEENTVYLLSYNNPKKYFSSGLNNKGCLVEVDNTSAAAEWYFEKADNDTFYIYTMVGGVKKYIHQKAAGGVEIELADAGTAFVLSEATDRVGTFIIKHSTEELYLQHSGGGGGIRFFGESTNQTNARIYITNNPSSESQNDPYELNGKSFGIAYHDDNTTAAAMSANKSGNSLAGTDMLMRPDMLSNKGILLVAENSDIQEWTFVTAGLNNYYIKTTVDGEEKYLRINGANVTLVDQASASMIKAEPGKNENSGKWNFSVGSGNNTRFLNFNGGNANSFNAVNSSSTKTWLNLVEKSPLSDDDFVEYTAHKISASDDILSATEKDEHGEIKRDDQGNPVYKENKAQVVIYTRVWNDTTKKYEFYAVDHDGSLVRVYDSGDQINWVGNKVNSALWEFTEYTNPDGTPTYFYELENTAYAGKYLAPQSEGIISDQPIGINLNGRREGYDYTSIVAWDDPAYAYSGLKIVTNEDGSLKVVTCPLDEADDFHFAVLTPPAEETTEVDTVDNDDFGISIKMIDFKNTIDSNNRDVVQRAYLGYRPWVAAQAYKAETGLVSTNLVNGYPTIEANTQMHGASLSGLFNNMTPANHLFIQSVYNESGYFEYDSTQNFAHLNTVEDAAEDPEKKVGDFTVYNQLGAIGNNTGATRVHGQFMPFNDISAETGYAYDSSGNVIRNLNDIAGHELPDSDPRKGEPLYLIPQNKANYFFGMELSAVFTQTPDGVDNWGHDIIFEFTGDDDFWFYVDGELVLDLGGVHSAIGGSVNFRTGEVVCNGTTTSLYEVFRQNYAARGLDVSKVDELFVTKIVNGETVHVFSDYTTHEMKMFYMERGAGASNLRMRFNLASVKPGTVELSKKLKGAEHTSNKLIQYPYQIWYQTVEYQMNEDGTYALGEDGNRIIVGYNKPQLLEQPPKNTNLTGKVYAVYKGTKKLIPFKESMKIGGFTYQNVFLLKAGETAVINFPENTYRYKLVECGVDTAVYDHVYINGAESGNKIFGKPHNNTDGWEYDPETGEEILPTETTTYEGTTRSDFGITYNTTEGRPRVEYTNEVPPEVMRTLSIKKVLYDAEGHLLSDQDAAALKTAFNYRLYLGNEFAEQDSLEPADMYTYYVKGPGPNSKYCKWDKANQEFVPLGVTTFDEFKNLSEDDQRAGTFTTSIYGAISKIPAGYTVEVRDLIVGTKYKIEEPDREIPKGYTRCDGEGYVRTDTDPDYIYYTDGEGVYGQHPYPEEGDAHTAEPISDTIASKTESPQVEIRNQEGWGLTAQKEWTDKDFMIHEPIYLAIYLKGTQGEGSGEGQGTGQGEGQSGSQDNLGDLVAGTVRRLNTGETEVYWFFQDLKIDGEPHSFGEFIVREVVLTDPVVDEDTGVVTSYSSITPVGEGQSINVSGKTYGGNERTESYTVNYVTGKSSGKNENIRTDTVKNSRPGIQIYKTNWDGDQYLSGAVFTLKDSGGSDVGHATYTSDRTGLVTTAYLNAGQFTLSEIRTPTGYVALDQPITITVTTTEPDSYDLTVTSGGTTYYIVLSGPEGFYTTAEATAEDMARIIVKNRTVQDLTVVKVGVDGSTRTPLTGVHFALYDQVRDSEGNVRPAYTPKAGYDDLVTKDGGLLEEITMDLGRGTYYLREKEAPSGYKNLAEDVCFTIGVDGTVVINNADYTSWLTRDDTTVPGAVSYQISIENRPLGITFRKTDEAGQALPGSKFKLCIKNDAGIFVAVTGIAGIGDEGLIDLTGASEMTFSGLGHGIYKLTEDHAPEGHIILTKDICFSVANGSVTLTDEDGVAKEYPGVSLLDNNTTVAVVNPGGAELPHTGGPGTWMFTFGGVVMVLFAAAGLLLRRRRIL